MRPWYEGFFANGQRGWKEIAGHLVLDERTWDEEGLRLRRRLRGPKSVANVDGFARRRGQG